MQRGIAWAICERKRNFLWVPFMLHWTFCCAARCGLCVNAAQCNTHGTQKGGEPCNCHEPVIANKYIPYVKSNYFFSNETNFVNRVFSRMQPIYLNDSFQIWYTCSMDPTFIFQNSQHFSRKIAFFGFCDLHFVPAWLH